MFLIPMPGSIRTGIALRFEQGERQGKEFEARFDHQDRADAPGDPGRFEDVKRHGVALAVELLEGPVRVCRSPRAVATGRAEGGQRVGLELRHRSELGGDVDDVRPGAGAGGLNATDRTDPFRRHRSLLPLKSSDQQLRAQLRKHASIL